MYSSFLTRTRYKALSPLGRSKGMQMKIRGEEIFMYDPVLFAVNPMPPHYLVGELRLIQMKNL